MAIPAPMHGIPFIDQTRVLFYAERILEQMDRQCYCLARKTFDRYRDALSHLIGGDAFRSMQERVLRDDDWCEDKEIRVAALLEDANSFEERSAIHDLAHEMILHHKHRADRCATHDRCERAQNLLSMNNQHYIEPDEIALNTYVDSTIEFVVEKRRPKARDISELKGNPGFYWRDVLGNRYRCFVKQHDDLQPGDSVSLKITNVPGMQIGQGNATESILYLEPRVSAGQHLAVKLNSLSYTQNSFTFRHNSYDGFLWFKRRGVNKELFNEHTLSAGDEIGAKVLYVTDEIKRSPRGTLTRLGIVKAIPVQRVVG